MTDQPKLSPVETAKASSNYLRGDIAQELVDGNEFFGKDSIQLLKHFGTYQQDNRDDRASSRAAGGGKSYFFMVRSRVPGGKLTAAQMLAELDLADEVGNTTLRITSRQGLQLHGVIKGDLHKTIRRINEIQLSTLAACGDVNRNVMCCPAPLHQDPVRQQLQNTTDQIAEHMAPRTRAYHELWLRDPQSGQDELVGGGAPAEDVEPIYGKHYLPRKFKIAVGLASDNCVDLYANDLAFMAITEGDEIIGYNVLVGGGMGTTPSAAKTFPAVAKRMCFIRPEQVIDVTTAVVGVQRDFGNRADRKIARLKYLIHNWGIEAFKAKVEEYYGARLDDCHPDDVHGFDDHMGWHAQGDGRWFYGLNVENGRLHDTPEMQLKAAVREVCRTLSPGLRLTAHQSMLITDLTEEHRPKLEEILRRHNVPLTEDISNARRWSMACVAWPTCGLAITESERALPGMIDLIEVELAKLGLSSETFTIRMTGCPNGCARPYNCDVGLVGKAAGKYTIFVGGRLLGDRLNFIFRDSVPHDDVVPSLAPLFLYFKQERTEGETFGDFCHRKGAEDLRAWSEQHGAQPVT